MEFMNRIMHLIRKNTKLGPYYIHMFLMLSQCIARFRKVKTVKVMGEEWDYLIVLDACRYDYFKKYINIEGKLEKKISRGSHTLEWLKENFNDYYDDIIYVSANPYISNIETMSFKGSDHFFRVEPVWDYGWDEEMGTVEPRKVVEAALRVRGKFPSKRMIIHFLQPHSPYIGETRISRKEICVRDSVRKEETVLEILRLSRDGTIPVDVLRKAYADNLKLVLNEVIKLVEQLRGKVVVTADHGDCHGEYFIYGHPPGLYIKQVREVPWLTIERSTIGDAGQEVEAEEIRTKIKRIRKSGKI